MATAPQAQNIGGKRSHRGFIYLIAEDIRQHAKQVCEEALIAQQKAQEIVHLCKLARRKRQSDHVERILCQEHRLNTERV